MKIQLQTRFKNHIFLICSFIILYITSCENDKTAPDHLKLPLHFNFNRANIIGGVECYDTNGNIITSYQNIYLPHSYLSDEGSSYPYEKIELRKDSTALFFYTQKELLYVETGYFRLKNDTVHFYIPKRKNHEPAFFGYFQEHQFIMPYYGYKIVATDDEFLYPAITRYGYEYGELKMNELIDYMNRIKYNYKYNLLFIQKFEFSYDIVHEYL